MTGREPLPQSVTIGARLRRTNRITLCAAIAIVAAVIIASSFTLGLFSLANTTQVQARMLAESAAAALMFQDETAAQERCRRCAMRRTSTSLPCTRNGGSCSLPTVVKHKCRYLRRLMRRPPVSRLP